MKFYSHKININEFIEPIKKGIDNLRSGISRLSLNCLTESALKFNK